MGLSPQDEVDTVAELLGHKPRGAFTVVVRDEYGVPAVIKNDPFLYDGTPMPTLYWLCSPNLIKQIGRLESTGGVDQAEREVDEQELRRCHDDYAKQRDALIPPEHSGPRPSGGVAGTRTGVKCLHAHYAHLLAGFPDPVGKWVEAKLQETT